MTKRTEKKLKVLNPIKAARVIAGVTCGLQSAHEELLELSRCYQAERDWPMVGTLDDIARRIDEILSCEGEGLVQLQERLERRAQR